MKNGGECPLGAEQNVCHDWKDKDSEGVCVGGKFDKNVKLSVTDVFMRGLVWGGRGEFL